MLLIKWISKHDGFCYHLVKDNLGNYSFWAECPKTKFSEYCSELLATRFSRKEAAMLVKVADTHLMRIHY